MKKSFTIGMVTGAASLLIAVPVIAQISSAQGTSSSAATTRPVPTQACVQAQANLATAMLSNFDTENAAHKAELQTRASALAAAAALTDDAARKAALEKIRADEKAAHQAKDHTPPVAVQQALDAVKTACAGTMGGFGHKGMGPMDDDFGGPMMGKQGKGWGMRH